MYKIFVNDRPIILTNVMMKEDGFKVFLLKSVEMNYVIRKLQRNNLSEVYLYHPDADKLLSIFKDRMGYINAGGGLVKNDKNELLFIERNEKWDLPKGRAEKGEDIETTSLREVEEETGVQNLSINRFLQETYHIYKNKGKYNLKITYWYLMETDYSGELRPQTEEGITQAVWKTNEQAKVAMSNSYANVVLLTEAYLASL
ncbi:MAG: NUDIX domain-containing protein [Flavobacteriaceae bacterium]|nr:NUDIX domain-containing protein [Flavobacteriaceae bacterium]